MTYATVNLGTPPSGQDGDTVRTGMDKLNTIINGINNGLQMATRPTFAGSTPWDTGNLSPCYANSYNALSGAVQFAFNSNGIAGGYALGSIFMDNATQRGGVGMLGAASDPNKWQTMFFATGAAPYDEASSPSGVWADYSGALRSKGTWTHTGSLTSSGVVAAPNGLSTTSFAVTGFSGGAYASVWVPNKTGPSNPLVFYSAAQAVIGSIGTNDSSTAYNTTSDYRLKANYALIVGALGSVNRMKFYSGEFRASPGVQVDYGIAHELAAEAAFAVTGEKDAVQMWPILREGADPKDVHPDDVIGLREEIIPQSVDYSKLVPRLGAAIQELSALYDAALARIAALEART